MSGADEEELAKLMKVAREAAPAKSVEHLDDATLSRLRGDDEDASLDDAYRHVASCVVCRARLADGASSVAVVRAAKDAVAAPKPMAIATATKIVPLRGRVIPWAAAAVFLLALGGAFYASRLNDRRVALTQRALVGAMGGDAAVGDVAASDKNIEIVARAPSFGAASLFVYDTDGHALLGARAFERQSDASFRVVVAPRSFAPHQGAAFGLVALGDATTIASVKAPTQARTLDEIERALRDRGLRVERITLGE